ncbi:MAG: hypothetical protein FWF29_05690 [Treponema sp.]|nr:hypothetical protein [Treponema sp.]
MKRSKTLLLCASLLAVLLSMSACKNFFNQPLFKKPAPDMGFVQVYFDSAYARTLLPSTYTFDQYMFTFTPVGTQNNGVPLAVTYLKSEFNDTFELETGSWKLNVAVYLKLDGVNMTEVAAATNIPVNVPTNGTEYVEIPLSFDTWNGTGTLSWNITVGNDINITNGNNDPERSDVIKIILMPLSGGDEKDIVIYDDTSSDNSKFTSKDSTIQAGFYNINIELQKDMIQPGTDPVFAKQAIGNNDNILHIYPGQETTVTANFTASKLSSGIKQIWFVGGTPPVWTNIPDGTIWDVPIGVPMFDLGTGLFTWTGNMVAGSTFRFSLTDTSSWTTPWNGAWFAPQSGSATDTSVQIGNNGMTFIPLDQTVDNNWKITQDGEYTITVDPHPVSPVFYIESNGLPKLSAVSQPELDSQGMAAWTGLSDETNVVSYLVQLFESGTLVKSYTIIASGSAANYTKDFYNDINTHGAGNYTVKVTAQGTNDSSGYQNSQPSDASEIQIATKLQQVAKPSWVGVGTNVVTWSDITDNSGKDPGGTVTVKYTVQLYKDGNEVTGISDLVTAPVTTTNAFVDYLSTADYGSYTFTVTAKGANLVLDADESAPSDANVVMNYLWLVGDMNSWDRSNQEMDKNVTDGVFTWKGNATVGDRFKLSPVTDTEIWFGSASNAVEVPFGSNEYVAIFYTAATDNCWEITSTGYYVFTFDKNAKTLRVERPINIDTVTITTHPDYLVRGQTYTNAFGVTYGPLSTNADLATVTYSITGLYAGDAHFDESNKIEIASDEPWNNPLDIIATASALGISSVVSDPIELTIRSPYGINFYIDDLGTGIVVTGPTTQTIYKTGEGTFTHSVDFTVTTAPAGTTSYIWFVDGKPLAGENDSTITLDAGDYSVGFHSVRLAIMIDSVPWSFPDANLGFDVKVKAP